MINVSGYMGYVQVGMTIDRIASFQKGRIEVNGWGALQSITTSKFSTTFPQFFSKILGPYQSLLPGRRRNPKLKDWAELSAPAQNEFLPPEGSLVFWLQI